MTLLAIATMVAISLVGSRVAIAADNNEDSWEEFAAAMEKLRDIEQRIRAVPENDIGRVAREAASEVGEMNVDQGGAFVTFYHGRLLGLAGETHSAVKQWSGVAGAEPVAPEAIWAIVDLLMEAGLAGGRTPLAVHRLTRCEPLGALLPLSSCGRTRDREAMPSTGIGGPRISVPGPRPVQSLQLADALEQMGMHQHAAVVYREFIYHLFENVRVTKVHPGQTWMSPHAAAYWLRAAEQEWLAGRGDQASAYLAKAWVFGDRVALVHEGGELVVVHEAARALLQTWRREGLPAEPPKPEPNADRLKQAVDLYQRMHLHPRALQLLNEYGDVLGEATAAEVRKNVEEQWLEYLVRYCRRPGAPRCVLWGQDITDEERRLEMTVPPPASEEATKIAAAWAEKIVKLMEDQRH